MARKITSFCVALYLMLAAVAGVPRRVNCVADLPTDALTLLYWFAQNVNIYSNGIWLNFDPSTGSYGSHYYGNYEGLLETLPWGYQYFTIGNINDGSFPYYVHNKVNKVRIIVTVRKENNRLTDRIFLTQHTGIFYDSDYDPQQTYEVTAEVLQELARLSLNEIQQRAANYPAKLQGNAPRDVYQAYSFSNQSNYTRPSSEDNFLPCLCFGFLFIILVIFFIIAGNQKLKQH